MKKQITGYHFTGGALRDGRPIPAIGEWLEHSGPVIPCSSGLHCSEHPFDALAYAPGNKLHRVILEGDLKEHGESGITDKWCGSGRQITATISAEHMMRDFARWCALQVMHLWDAPLIVRQYLETGDESIRTAAGDAAGDAAMYAARTAAGAAAGDAAWAAAWGAAWGAVGAAAWTAARAAARAAAGDAQRNKFKDLVDAAFGAGKGQA